MEGIMVEFILWTDNPKTDIDKISHYIGIQPTEKKRMGEMRYIIVAYLDDLNKMYTTSKYDTAIKFLKFWSVFILIAMFAYGYSSIGRYEYMTFR